MSDPGKYVVGWICAIATEYIAAQEFLDDEHEGPAYLSSNDPNDYTLGKIGEHNVVIAVLPDGEYGTAAAASVAANMLNSFPNVRIGLMVGIGGGVPSDKHDIRLGDVVVSAARNGHGGVLQYDFGKSIQAQSFERTRLLDQPPTTLRTAISGIQAQYKRKGHQLAEAIDKIIDTNPRLRREYTRPQQSTDQLFKADVLHDPRGCQEACVRNYSNLVQRRERTEYDDNPAIHYGLIASGNQLMKDALIRDRLAAEKDVLCFGMEAAGLMNSFPCLVIRGICDYSDSHKNKEWQGYAAMVAAAYAKDLMSRIPPSRVEAEKKIGELLSGLQSVAEDQRKIAHRQLEIQENEVKQKLSDKQRECLHLFRLTSSDQDVTYEWYKDRVERRVEGTCEWFLNHQDFRHWLHQDSGSLLVSADPGCGKSVLSKYLIDERLPRSATICYFFFKYQDQNTIRQALCALLHQLFVQKPELLKYAIEVFNKDGRGLINSTTSLWTILGNAVRDSLAGPITIVLDALDECAESECEDLVRNILAHLLPVHSSRLKLLLTSRPYEQIMSNFRNLLGSFPYVRIPGEEESESIGQEVNLVIDYRVKQLAKAKYLSDRVEAYLAQRLLGIEHRTYLWVYLVFDYLERQQFKKTTKGVDNMMSDLPISIYGAYEKILARSIHQEPMVRRALSMILAASRPLTVSEINIALSVDKTSKSFGDLDLEADNDFQTRLRNWCGLFVSIYYERVYFIHQTAREFLLAQTPETTLISQDLRWQHSITHHDAHGVLAEACVLYLDLFNHDPSSTDTDTNIGDSLECSFLDYSARKWGDHYREADISTRTDLFPSTLSIYNPMSRSWSAWFNIFREEELPHIPGTINNLAAACYFGHENVVRHLLDQGPRLESTDPGDANPLLCAALNGHEAIVSLLLDRGASFELETAAGQPLLSWAVATGQEAMVKLLLDRGVNPESRDVAGRTALSYAASESTETILRLLLHKGANLNSEDRFGRTPLSYAATYADAAIVELLIDKGAKFESKDNSGLSPLSHAIRYGNHGTVKLLIDRGAVSEPRDLQQKRDG